MSYNKKKSLELLREIRNELMDKREFNLINLIDSAKKRELSIGWDEIFSLATSFRHDMPITPHPFMGTFLNSYFEKILGRGHILE